MRPPPHLFRRGCATTAKRFLSNLYGDWSLVRGSGESCTSHFEGYPSCRLIMMKDAERPQQSMQQLPDGRSSSVVMKRTACAVIVMLGWFVG